jgi:hypothetical protein
LSEINTTAFIANIDNLNHITMKNGYKHRVLDTGIQIDLRNGVTLRYKIDASTMERLQDFLGEIDSMAERKVTIEIGLEFMSFQTGRDRLVLINLRQISRITFTSAERFGEDFHGYMDNFALVPSKEELQGFDEDYGSPPGDGTEDILPYAVVYHNGANSSVANPFIFEDLESDSLLLSWSEILGEVKMPDFIRIRDENVEYNYIRTDAIICMEICNHLIKVKRVLADK